jgi:UDP-N-acetylglucosamine acyltransferase
MSEQHLNGEEYNIYMRDWYDPKDVTIHPTSIIAPNVEIGEGTYIGPFCIIGYPAEHKAFWPTVDGKGKVGKVRIGKNCRITGHVTIDASTGEYPTELGDNVWMLKHSHVGHDAYIGNDVTISCGAKIGGHCSILANSNIGLNACIHQWVTVPEHCMIGMNAAVTKKLEMKPWRKYAGVPAKDIGSNKR